MDERTKVRARWARQRLFERDVDWLTGVAVGIVLGLIGGIWIATRVVERAQGPRTVAGVTGGTSDGE